MTHSSETEISLGGGPNGKVVVHDLHFWPNMGIFGPFGPMADQKTMRTRCLGGSSVTWVPKLLLPFVKTRIFVPKKAKFGPKYAFLGTYRPCQFICYPVGWWLWRAGCILHDNYLRYMFIYSKIGHIC